MDRRKGGSKPERNRRREGKGKEESKRKKKCFASFLCVFFFLVCLFCFIARYTQAKPSNKLKLIE